MNYVIEREIDSTYAHISSEISRVLNWLAARNMVCKSKKHMIWDRYPGGQWALILKHYEEKRGSLGRNHNNIYQIYKYTGSCWWFYVLYSSDVDGRERRDSVLITNNEVLGVEFKLTML
jgi:hypothetical protein